MNFDELYANHTFHVLLEDFIKARKKNEELAKLRLKIWMDFIASSTPTPFLAVPSSAASDPDSEDAPTPQEIADSHNHAEADKKRRIQELESRVDHLIASIEKQGEGKAQFSMNFKQDYPVDQIPIWLISKKAKFSVVRIDPPGNGGRFGSLGHMDASQGTAFTPSSTSNDWTVHFSRIA